MCLCARVQIEAVEGPIAAISIMGPYRSGKRCGAGGCAGVMVCFVTWREPARCDFVPGLLQFYAQPNLA